MDKINKLSLPASILIASIVFGGFYYFSQLNKQKSIERMQETALAQEKKSENSSVEKQIQDEYRKECEASQNKTIEQLNDFLDTCSKYNSESYCLNSEAGKLYQGELTPESIQACINNKKLKYSQ
ncbi:MAG: hypothetical protein NTZ44_03730 [Candidatus Nomurabacteria bacterium]|nr:hypothetical protein [Candidatus Nomurabacteria bacterium]